MRRYLPVQSCWLPAFAILCSIAGFASAESIPLEVSRGRCDLVLAGHGSYVLMLGSLDRFPKTCAISVTGSPTRAAPAYPRARRMPALPARLASSRKGWRASASARVAASSRVAVRAPLRSRTFFLYRGSGELQQATSYVAVRADLMRSGQQVQVYVDRACKGRGELDATAREIVRTFDDEIYPWSVQHLGKALDVDCDGRFSVLLTEQLDKLQQGGTPLDGFVWASDFVSDIESPLSNHCDVLYMRASLKPGPHLRTVLVHEFTHAVAFCEHTLNGPDSPIEESWVSEGLAHVVEAAHQHGWSNLDFRVAAFLEKTEAYPLVVPDYYGSGLWRTPGTRGSTFLFLRYCQAQTRGELPRRLIDSPFWGTENVSAAVDRPFAELFRDWGVSLVLDESWRLEAPKKAGGQAACKLPRGPRMTTIQPDGKAQQCELAGTSMKFYRIDTNGHGCAINIRTDATQELQATLIQLPVADAVNAVGTSGE